MQDGLLYGVGNVRTASFYSPSLQLWEASSLLSTGSLYKAAKLDAITFFMDVDDVLEMVIAKGGKWFDSPVLHNRKDALQNLLGNEGKITAVLGGKSTGKSFMWQRLQMVPGSTVFHIDMRICRGTRHGRCSH
jgi:hypothetical protein